jgi:hypothetical protein
VSFTSKIVELIPVIPLGALGWYATHFIGKPILTLEKHRQESLRLAERFAYHASTGAGERSDYDRINGKRMEINDEAAALRSFYRSAPPLVRAYSKFKGYDIEQAAAGLRESPEWWASRNSGRQPEKIP